MIFYVLHAGMTPPDETKRAITRKAKQKRATEGHTGRAGEQKGPCKGHAKEKRQRAASGRPRTTEERRLEVPPQNSIDPPSPVHNDENMPKSKTTGHRSGRQNKKIFPRRGQNQPKTGGFVSKL